MKATGIVRKVDDLGRVVLPVELRRLFGIKNEDPIEIYVEGSNIILEKYQPECVLCGGKEGMEEFREKNVCVLCREEAADL